VEHVEFETLSPFVPYSLYQAAVVQLSLWKRTEMDSHKNAFDSLKIILGHFKKRWLVAGTRSPFLVRATGFANINDRSIPRCVGC
jgi:hypothetical protein